MDTNPPRKHHYIPECYLKSFSNLQKQLWRRSKDISKCSLCSPSQIGYEKNGNRIRTIEIFNLAKLTDENYIEKNAFRQMENNYPLILSKLISFSNSPIVIDENDCRLFLKALVTIKRRNPTTRNILIQSYIESYNSDEAIPEFKAYLLEEAAKENILLNSNLEEIIENYIRSRVKNLDWLYDMYLSAYISPSDFKVIDNISNQLSQLKLFILHAPVNRQFITSDNPGFTRTKDELISVGGFGDFFEFYFPLTPSTCLYLNSSLSQDKFDVKKAIYPKLINDGLVSEINKYTKLIANKQLFGYSKSILMEL